ncbi:MAG: hypothetical protein JOZ45_03810 [Acidobacteriaceae bacterium]|nr:hypothetical protein [Acidobacteriaceae bacterium]
MLRAWDNQAKKFGRAGVPCLPASGQSVASFCRERGLRDGPFYEWKKRLRQRGAEPFVAVEIAAGIPTVLPLTAPVPNAPLEIRLSKGRSLLVGPDFEAAHLLRLLRALEQEP